MLLTYIDTVTGIVGDFDDLVVFKAEDVPEDITENTDSGISDWTVENADIALVLYPLVREVNQ